MRWSDIFKAATKVAPIIAPTETRELGELRDKVSQLESLLEIWKGNAAREMEKFRQADSDLRKSNGLLEAANDSLQSSMNTVSNLQLALTAKYRQIEDLEAIIAKIANQSTDYKTKLDELQAILMQDIEEAEARGETLTFKEFFNADDDEMTVTIQADTSEGGE